jgi:hypothetical protein
MKAFITFGAGGQNYEDACSRLTHQASQMNVFDTIIAFSENDLKDDNEFWSKHSDFILKNKRGYGNWLWKPYLIKKQMDKMKDGDILLYLDAGCELDIKKRDRMIECFSIVEKDLIIGTTLKNHLEKHWTKMDLFIELDLVAHTYLNSKQRQGGVNMFYVCGDVRKLVDEWYTISSIYNLLDFSKGNNINDPEFKEHRNDQSIFSLLTKKYKIFSEVSLSPVVEIFRNKSGKSKL